MSGFPLTVLAILAPPVVAYCVWQAVRDARTPQGAAAWVVFLVSSPWFAVPAFAVFGRRRLTGYTAAWRQSHLVTQEYAAYRRRHPRTDSTDKPLGALERIGGLPFTGGNDLRLLRDGEATFRAIFDAVDRAAHSICVQFYTIRDDEIGSRFGARLAEAAARGVAVRVMYDGVGSQALDRAWPQRLRAAGATVLNPHRARGPTSRFDINFRNHRKTVVVDGRVAFVGGHNVGDEYLGRDPGFGPWRDTHLELHGPVVSQVQLVFADDWHWASGERLETALLWEFPPPRPDGMTAALVPTGPGDEIDSGSLMFFTAITAATRRIWIASPYFVPDTDILSALIAASLAGRDVRILLPAAIDHYLPWLAAHAYFDEVRQAGVRIYRYRPGFMHQKVILADDDLAAVGTANLDCRSFRLNFESMVFSTDRGFAHEIERMLTRDMENAELLQTGLSGQGWRIRIGAPLARLLAPVL